MTFLKWNNLRLLLMILAVLSLYSFTSNRNNKRKLKTIEIVFTGESNGFITKKAVNKLLIENNTKSKSIDKVRLDLNLLEKKIDANGLIEKSDVYVSIDGTLTAVVKQKTPIARIFTGGNSYYIDYKGNKMPLSFNFTARVPLVLGEINKKNSEKLAALLRIIYTDEFLKKNIIGIEIMPNGSLKMMNRNYNYVINFGSTMRMQAKFNNYKAFFQKASQDSLLPKYKIIDLRFVQQVVCSK